MPSAKEDGEEQASGDGGEDTPDWTTWLRSRLERVSSSERTAARSAGGGYGDAVGDEQGGGEDPVSLEAPPADDVAPEAPPADDVAPEAPPAEHFSDPDAQPGEEADSDEPLAGDDGADDASSSWDTGRQTALWAPAAPAAPAAAPPPATAPVGDAALAVEIEGLRAAVTALVAGVATLSDTFTGFRDVVNHRLGEHGETMVRLSEDTAARLEDYHQVQAASAAELRHSNAEINDRLQELFDGLEALRAMHADDERWAQVMGRLLDEVDAERQAGERGVLTTGGVAERLEGMEQALGSVAGEVSEAMGRLVEQVDAHRRAGDEQALSAGDLVERLERLEQALDRVAGQVSELASAPRDPGALAPAVSAPAASKPPPPVPRPRSRPPGGRRAPLRADRRIRP